LFSLFVLPLLSGYQCIWNICGSVNSLCFLSLPNILFYRQFKQNFSSGCYRPKQAVTFVNCFLCTVPIRQSPLWSVMRISRSHIRRRRTRFVCIKMHKKGIWSFYALAELSFLSFFDFFSLGGFGGFSFFSFGLASPFEPKLPRIAPPPIISIAVTASPPIIIQPI
jgi:hypothetical protein